MKKILSFSIGFLLIIALLSYYFTGFTSNDDSKINTQKIRAITVGMSMENIISILGKPIQIADRYDKKGKTFTYTKVPKYKMTYPMLWIHFDKNAKVNQVFAKKYILWGADDECIYIQDSTINHKNYNQEPLRQMFR